MLFFTNDYGEGMHPELLKALADTNMEQLPGYGSDVYCQRAAEKIKAACHCPEGEVYFLTGGTQTNQVIIDTMLHPYEGVIAAATGHISIHEAGAIEYAGHKVFTLPQQEGKLEAARVASFAYDFVHDANNEHMPQPAMVYISYPTEYGTLYTREELEALSAACHEYGLKLFIDGARLGYGLMSKAAEDMTMADIAALADVFYIGGTKVGAICGEAVVFPRGNAPKHFVTSVKQHGALLAKGRLLGVQFDALFTDNLYLRIAAHAIEMAELITTALTEKGYRFYIKPATNQIFVVWPNDSLAALGEKVAYSYWEPFDEEHTVIRFATSWATTRESVEALKQIL